MHRAWAWLRPSEVRMAHSLATHARDHPEKGRDDQPAHLAPGPAGHGRRRRDERLRARAGPPPGRARRRGRRVHPSDRQHAGARGRGQRRHQGPPRLRGPLRGAHQARAPRAAVRVRARGAAHGGLQLTRLLRPGAQPLLAQRPGRRACPRPLGRPAGAHDAHHGQGQERRPRDRRHPRADGPPDRRGAGGGRRGHARGQHRRRGQAAARPVRRRPGSGRGRAPGRRPLHLP